MATLFNESQKILKDKNFSDSSSDESNNEQQSNLGQSSNEGERKPLKSVYRQRVLLLASRGIGYRYGLLYFNIFTFYFKNAIFLLFVSRLDKIVIDIYSMIWKFFFPMLRKVSMGFISPKFLGNPIDVLLLYVENKLDSKADLTVINEYCELNNCNNSIFFEVRKKSDLYIWFAKHPRGPSLKFYVQNVHTMDELKLAGNCLKGSRPILSFDKAFDGSPHLRLIKELLTQVFGVPKSSRRTKPFVDRVTSFTIADDRIWFRNYQIIEGEEKSKLKHGMQLLEIGPRLVLSLIKILGDSFSGPVIYTNPNFVSPNEVW